MFGCGFVKQRRAEDFTKIGQGAIGLEKRTNGLAILGTFNELGGGKEDLGFLAVADGLGVTLLIPRVGKGLSGREGGEARGDGLHPRGDVLARTEGCEDLKQRTAMDFRAFLEQGIADGVEGFDAKCLVEG